MDTETKKRRFEVPTFRKEHPLLLMHGDEGPKDLPCHYIMPANGFRWMFEYDPLHKIPRDMYWAAKAVGIWSDVLDVTYAMKLGNCALSHMRVVSTGSEHVEALS